MIPSGRAGAPQQPQMRAKILLVEPGVLLASAELLRARLSAFDYMVTAAVRSAEEALRSVAEARPELVLIILGPKGRRTRLPPPSNSAGAMTSRSSVWPRRPAANCCPARCWPNRLPT